MRKSIDMTPDRCSLSRVFSTGLVAILRAPSGQRLADVAEALLAGGVDVLEVTFTVPGAHRVLEQVADRLGDRILLGAGSVLDTETARIAMLAGAEFIVSPTVNLKVIEMCRRYGKPVMPGAMTPTEVLTAWEAGADIIKVFPVGGDGPETPQGDPRSAAADPADADRRGEPGHGGRVPPRRGLRLGVGGALAPAGAIAEGDMAKIESLARQFVDVVTRTREELGGKSR